jgi:type VI secretion system protein ImpH
MIEALVTSPWRYAFYQAAYLAEIAAGKPGMMGHLGPVAEEPLRFRAQLGLGFPAADIASAKPHDNDRAGYLELEVTFLGLYGAASPLPGDLTERLLVHDETGTTRDFLDIFNHRLISILYRIWRRYRFDLERSRGLDDTFSTIVRSLAGLADIGVDDAVDQSALLSSLRHLIGWTRSAGDLAAVLSAQFPGTACRVEEFVLRVFVIPEEARWSLGRGLLGDDLVLGDRMEDVSGRIRLHLQAPDWDSYSRFLPGGPMFGVLTQLVRRLLRDRLDVLVVPSLPLAARRAAQLTGCDFRLGLNTWLGIPNDGDAWPGFALGYG